MRFAHEKTAPGRWNRVPSVCWPRLGAGSQRKNQAASARSADSSVLTISIVIVIGPTPPGTGVMSEATSGNVNFPASRASAVQIGGCGTIVDAAFADHVAQV